MKRLFWLAAAILFVAGIQTSSAYELTGRIVSVADGDTVTLLDTNLRQHKIRLSGIDAPEKRQPFGNRSRLHLGALVFGKQVTADCPKKDRYKRAVCRLEVDGVDANLAQIEAGMAWHYKCIRAGAVASRPVALHKSGRPRTSGAAGPVGRPGAGGALGLQEGKENPRPVSAPAPGVGSVFHFRR